MKPQSELSAAIDRLADAIENGHLLVSTNGADLLNAAADEIDKLRACLLAVKMAHDPMVFNPRDWSKDSTDAWLWALFVGWDEEAEKEIVKRHGSAMHGACHLGRQIAALLDEKEEP